MPLFKTFFDKPDFIACLFQLANSVHRPRRNRSCPRPAELPALPALYIKVAGDNAKRLEIFRIGRKFIQKFMVQFKRPNEFVEIESRGPGKPRVAEPFRVVPDLPDESANFRIRNVGRRPVDGCDQALNRRAGIGSSVGSDGVEAPCWPCVQANTRVATAL
jgi:hypothetical protein